MTHWKKTVKKDSPYLGEWDIEGKSPLTLTIESVTEETAKSERGETTVLCVHFRGAKKGMILNSTNATILERQAGTPDREKWVGHKITLRRATCYNRTEGVDETCIRFDKGEVKTLPKRMPKFTYIDAFPATPKQDVASVEKIEPATTPAQETK
jgi:hypothetical protein